MFKVGEKVAFFNDPGFGVIVAMINANQFRVLDEYGFEQVYSQQNLVKIHGEMSDDDSNPHIKDDETPEVRSNYSVIKDRSSALAKDYWELDLHIESLTDDHRGMSNFDIMKTQMQEFKRFFSKAKANGMHKLVVIHGVGEGILKNEIRNYLAQQEFVEFYDASYLEYGKGATEIRLFQTI